MHNPEETFTVQTITREEISHTLNCHALHIDGWIDLDGRSEKLTRKLCREVAKALREIDNMQSELGDEEAVAHEDGIMKNLCEMAMGTREIGNYDSE